MFFFQYCLPNFCKIPIERPLSPRETQNTSRLMPLDAAAATTKDGKFSVKSVYLMLKTQQVRYSFKDFGKLTSLYGLKSFFG
jgi:hypothetical protein